MATKKITDLTQLTDLDATDSFVVNDSGAGADKRVEFSDLQSEVLNGAAIGTSTAITELQVDNLNLNGNTFSSTDTNGNILIQPNGTGATVINESGAASDFRVEGDTDQNLLFVDASTDRVGIGTATPASLLDVDGDLTITDKIIHSGDTNTAIRFPSADTVTVETAGTERMRIDSSGNVGIGVTPSFQLDVRSTSVPAIRISRSGTAGSNAATGITFEAREPTVGTGETSAIYGISGNLVFRTGGTSGDSTGGSEIARFTSDGLTFNGDTAAANALDDYDTGTYTATLTPSTSGTITLNPSIDQLSYTKIGRLVTITGKIDVSSVSSPVGYIQLNTPTVVASLSEQSSRIGTIIPIRFSSEDMNKFLAWTSGGESFLRIVKIGTTDFTNDSAETFSGDESLYIHFTYVSA